MPNVIETLPQVAMKFEELSAEIKQLEPVIDATKELLGQWREQTPEQLTQLLSQCDEWQEKLSGHQAELGTAADEMGEQLEQLGQQLTTTKSELEQEAGSLKEAFAGLRSEYEGIDAEMATLFDEAEKAFQEAAQELSESQKSLTEAVNEAEAFLLNDVRNAYEQARAEATASGEALKAELVQSFVPEVRNQSQKLMEHLRQVTTKVETRFRAVIEQAEKNAKESLQTYKDAHKGAIGEVQKGVRSVECAKGQFLETASEAEYQLQKLHQDLEIAATVLTGGIYGIGRLLNLW